MDSNITAALMLYTFIVPLIGALLLLFTVSRGNYNRVKFYALTVSSLTFVLSVVMAWGYDWSAAVPLPRHLPWVESFGLRFAFSIDPLSIWLILLTTFLMPITILGSFSALQGELVERGKEFFAWLLLLEAAMLGTFLASDVIFFYICFEFTLIPLYFLIGIFGSTQRLKAAKVFFLYTYTGSMLTFAGVLYVAWFNTTLPTQLFVGAGAWSFDMQTLYGAARQMSDTQQALILFTMLAGFAVKVPLFPVHTWLPLAHTEAPTAGSVILAGVLLKLGTYGLLRLAIPMTPIAVIHYAPLIGTLAVIGILYTALICWVQKDIKKLIAYSSVSHLGFCVLGMFALNAEGLGGSVLYMINHGLSTGALFLCVGMIYERFHTREMAQINGLARVMPVWSFFMVFFCLASVGLPGLNGFVGEFLTLLGAFKADAILGPRYALLAGVGMIFGAIYILYMVGKVVFGAVKLPQGDHGHGDAHATGHHAVSDLRPREIATLVPLAVACLVLGLYPAPILESIQSTLVRLARPANIVVALQTGSYDAAEGQTHVILMNPTKASRLTPPKAPSATPDALHAPDAPKHDDTTPTEPPPPESPESPESQH